jgi:hypothetical protein
MAQMEPQAHADELGKNKDFSTLSDYPVPAEAVFECLGRVEFEGSAYIGYGARGGKSIIAERPLTETRRQELSRKPQEWRSVFVDPQGRLPAHDLVAQKDQLDSPSYKVRYTYPNDVKIEPPLWCRVGLCPVSR